MVLHGTKEWRRKWEDYRDGNGRVWPEYDIMVSPRIPSMFRESQVTFNTLLKVGKNRLVPISDTWEVHGGDPINKILKIYERFEERVSLHQEKFIPTKQNTIKTHE